MATSTFFNQTKHFNEQQLIDDLVIESIKIYGVDIEYLPRTAGSVDNILNEDDTPLYNSVYKMEMYVKSVDGFEGEGDFLSKFGLQIRDQVTFTVAIRTFERYVTKEVATRTRPLEGDIIYFPINGKLFKVMYVEHESVFYQSGALQVYDLRCELLEYSNERIETGFSHLDDILKDYQTTVGGTSNTNTLEALANADPIADNFFFEKTADDIIDFTEMDPFSETINFDDDEPPEANT
jgi:hypothetical protein